MLRLDPAHPPLWRSATCLQFGTQGAARVDDPQPWELRVIAALERGLAETDALALARAEGASADQLDALVLELAPVLREERPSVSVAVSTALGIPDAVDTAVRDAMERAGARVHARPSPGDAVIVLAAHLVPPHQAAALVSDDVTHLPVVLDDAGARIGPLVIPGRTGCLACEARHACDADEAWPLIASQLVGRPAAIDLDLATEAARVAVQLLSAPDADPSRSVRLNRDSPHRVWRQHRAHEDCRCRSLGGTATEPVRLVPARSAPSSARAYARPA